MHRTTNVRKERSVAGSIGQDLSQRRRATENLFGQDGQDFRGFKSLEKQGALKIRPHWNVVRAVLSSEHDS